MPDKLIGDFISDCRAAGLSPKTIVWYQQMLTAWSAAIKPRNWRDPTVTRDFIANLHSRTELYQNHPKHPTQTGNLSVFTIRGYIRSIKRFFNWLVEQEVLVDSPVKKLRIPKAPKRIPRAIAKEDFDKMLATCLTKRDHAMLLLLRDTGCRVSEICGLRIKDVDLDRGLVFVCGKGNQERFTFIGEITSEAIREHIRERKANPSDWMFITDAGVQCGQSTVHAVLKRCAKRAGVQNRHNCHSVRHAFARDWLLDGGDLASLSDILGHCDIETTKVYATFTIGELQQLHRRHSPVKKGSE